GASCPVSPGPSGWGRCMRPPFGRHAGRVQRGPAPVEATRSAQAVQQPPVDAVPHPGRLPVAQAAPAGHPRPAPQLLGQHLPGDAGLEHEDDPGQRGAIRHARSAALGLRRLGRQQRGDDGPQVVAHERGGHASSLPRTSPVL
ncbi:MAG: hypothetical protein AVDCRST_MAG19-1075, partial [uncultured Thermomicrobiales bacterium]